jgi:hypothetical protein
MNNISFTRCFLCLAVLVDCLLSQCIFGLDQVQLQKLSVFFTPIPLGWCLHLQFQVLFLWFTGCFFRFWFMWTIAVSGVNFKFLLMATSVNPGHVAK